MHWLNLSAFQPLDMRCTYSTTCMFQVFLRPNGPVPVVALEWRIKADVPTNLVAVKKAAESLRPPVDGM